MTAGQPDYLELGVQLTEFCDELQAWRLEVPPLLILGWFRADN
jgi:hypothetical protein